MKKNLNKLIIVGVLIVVIVLVIVLKNKTKSKVSTESEIKMVESSETSEIDSIKTFQQKPDNISKNDEIQRQENIISKQVEKSVEIPETIKMEFI